ncbi:hypothetical protein DFJ74DRAFT_770036 [Hyaloraphidium curvatum]|nr:hypothetical protein DFJ74DRAFT_770036 [Hyaloraphidium curvatum]
MAMAASRAPPGALSAAAWAVRTSPPRPPNAPQRRTAFVVPMADLPLYSPNSHRPRNTAGPRAQVPRPAPAQKAQAQPRLLESIPAFVARTEKRNAAAEEHARIPLFGAIPMFKLPWMPGFKEGFEQFRKPGGEDNDFRIKFGESLYLSCSTTIGVFSRKAAPCPSGKQSFRAGKYCLAVDRKSNVVLTPCFVDQPNGVWIYDGVTGQLSSKGSGVARASDPRTEITRADVEYASLASDGKCITVTKSKKVRVMRSNVDSIASMKVQRFTMRINVESINLGDLVTFHATGLYEHSYIAADPADGSVALKPGDLDVQQADNLAAFKVVEQLCGANYHSTLESVAKPGFYLSSVPGKQPGLVLTDKPANKNHACWLPTPGPARPKYASGCPGIIFGLRSRGFMLSCWRPVPPLGAPSAANPFPDAGGEPEDSPVGGMQEEDIASAGMEDEEESGEFGSRCLDPRRKL